MSKKRINWLRGIFLSIGAVLLVVLIKKIGLKIILSNMSDIGWNFLPIIVISFIWCILYTIGWEQFLKKFSSAIKFWDLFKIKIIGEAVNTLTPASFIGGDSMRIYLLKQNVSAAEGAASVVVDRTLQSMSTMIVVVFGIITAFLLMEQLPENIKYGVPIVIVVFVTFITFIFIHQRRGIFGLLLSVLKKLRIKKEFSRKTIERFEQLDAHIVDFYQTNNRGFLTALSVHTLGRLLGILEIYIIGSAMSSEFTIFTALVLTALAPMVNALFTFVPGALGIMEGAYSGVLYLLGLDPALGITIQIARRIRATFWIALGLLFLGSHNRKKMWEEKDLLEKV